MPLHFFVGRGTETIWTWRGWEICQKVRTSLVFSVRNRIYFATWVFVHLSLQHHLTFFHNIKDFWSPKNPTPQVTTTKTLSFFVILFSSTSTIFTPKKTSTSPLKNVIFSIFVSSKPSIPQFPSISTLLLFQQKMEAPIVHGPGEMSHNLESGNIGKRRSFCTWKFNLFFWA